MSADTLPVPTAADLARSLDEIGQDQHICIEVSQQRALTGLPRQGKDRADQGGALIIALHAGQVHDGQLGRGFSQPAFFTNHDHFDLGPQAFPALQRIALDDVNMRVGERLGGREQGQQ